MLASTITAKGYFIDRLPLWLAILSGILGIFSFGCLIVYIVTPSLQMQPSGAIDPMGKQLLTLQFLTSMGQALLVIPLAVWLHDFRGRRHSGSGSAIAILGIVALGGVALLRCAALVDPDVSDILFMIPMGLVGVWLALVNWKNRRSMPRWLRILGGVAAICLLGVGLNFFLNGGLVVFSKGTMAYGDDVNFHIGLGLSGVPGFTLFPLWCILMGLHFRKPPQM
ncbi:FtsH-binding integral membrane protein [Granulicella aggregans]|uniref:FtsH-binding integral membrane protein n=1 Tax=Granulicella aggregans TaxID=474949 RepID=A0A7W7ZJ33_9BACT|nr:hypothetical protein [Granulicella aggregans]MBB5060479.1 FtsH-binding integral membrane protein [Granulicella aggregans]